VSIGTILIIVLVVILLGGGGGYYYGGGYPRAAAGGLGLVLVVLLILAFERRGCRQGLRGAAAVPRQPAYHCSWLAWPAHLTRPRFDRDEASVARLRFAVKLVVLALRYDLSPAPRRLTVMSIFRLYRPRLAAAYGV